MSPPSNRPSTPVISTSTNPPIPTTRPATEIRLPPTTISAYQSLLSLPPRSPLITFHLTTFPSKLLKRTPGKLPSFLQRFVPRGKRTPAQCCELCELHFPLLEAPLVHLMGLLAYEMYTHLQSLRAMHPSQRSEVTNELLGHLHPWFGRGFFEPGTTIKGCLACALGLLYNDSEAMRAVALLAKSGRKRRQGGGGGGGGVVQPRLVGEGWLGYWAEVRGGVEKIRGDRNRAMRREVRVSTRIWDPRTREGVVFAEVVWGERKRERGGRDSAASSSTQSPRTVVVEPSMSAAKLVAPLRPDRPQGLTLSASVLGVQKTTSGSSSPKPAFPEKSRFRAQVGLESPVSPMTRASPVLAFGSPKARDRRSQLSRASSERSSRTTGTARGQRPSPGPSKMRERQRSGSSSSSSSSSSRSQYCRRRQRIATPLRQSQTTNTVHGPGSSAIAPESKRAKDLAAASSSSPRNRRCEPPPDSQLRRSQTANTAQSANPRKSDLNVSIPAPLNLKRNGSDDTNPFADPKRARSTRASATKSIVKDNPFFSHEERKWNLPSPTSDTDEDDGEGIVAPSVIPGGEYSDSAYSDDTDTEQRFLEEHDTLMKLVGRGQLRTRDYLNTLPERMESRD